MYLGQVSGGQVFFYLIRPEELFVKVDDMDISLNRPPTDPAATELAIKIGGDGKLVRCSHNAKVGIHPISNIAPATK